jgi:hypothetical protein
MISALSQNTSLNVSTTQDTKRPSADDVFKKLDSDNKGYLTESDVVEISSAGHRAADAAKAEEAFKQMDADGDGKVTETEFTAAAEAQTKTDASGKSERTAGSPPAGAGKGRSGGAPSSAKQLDPADANKDGKVSQEEQLAYDTKQQQAQNEATGNISVQAADALKAYQAVSDASDKAN